MKTIQCVLRPKGKCKIPAKMHICMVNHLPTEIILEIVSRLPTDSILECKLVCKTWLDLIRHPSFALTHLQRNVKVGLGLLFPFSTYSGKHDNLLYYVEYDDQPNKKLRMLNQPSINFLSIVGSRNGLICYSDCNGSNIHEPVHISNPVTSEFMKFPRLEVNGVDKVDTMVCGFGYLPSTDTYKTVKIYYIKDQPTGRVQVYTLGDGSCSGWRDIGEIAYSLRYSGDFGSPYHPCSFGAFANGALHWLDNEQNIVSFNLADEKLYLLQSPPLIGDLNRDDSLKLQVFGGCLCFIHKKRNKFLHMWFLRKNGESSSSSDINEQECDSLTWIKELSLPTDSSPIALTKSGEYLMWYDSNVCSYDPKTATMKKLALSYHFGTAEPHMNSFVSLKALGGKCRSRKRYAVNPSPTKYFIKQQRKYNGEFVVTQF